MRKKTIIGIVLIIAGIIVEILWRASASWRAHYDNAGPGYYLVLPGVILFIIGLSQQRKARQQNLDDKHKTCGQAIGSLVLGLFSLIPLFGVPLAIIGIGLGVTSILKIKKTGMKGKSLAVAGIILACAGIGIAISVFY